ncbi:hypothetical protein KP79_PYT25292 [Mizuhopecten yessoensis]|uniref:CARD domain-containing protein n=1 Tax=Mizuhopecten yessoensis TaxID=6573 RepID=A0A210PM72_MIZYE|nr:hypothetical protein KP79_PYT25292 [Mizuhopecten yessoensis]
MESDLIKSLEPRLIIDFLYEQEVITLDEHGTLNDDTNIPRNDRRRQLLEYIKTRGEKAFSLFKEAVASKPELSELSNQLKGTQIYRTGSPRKRRKTRGDEPYKRPRKSQASKQYKRMRKETKRLAAMTVVPKPLSSERKHIKYVEKAFDKLADMYNNGQHIQFAVECEKLKADRHDCADTLFTVAYMQILFAQQKLDCTSEENLLALSKSLVPKTKDPMYSQLLLLSPLTRRYILQRRFGKFKDINDEGIMIVESNPLHCTGRGAAWVYYNEGRSNALQLDLITDKNEGESQPEEIIRERTLRSYNRSLQHFNEDKGHDRTYGAAYVKFQLVVLLLRCGCNGLSMGRKISLQKKDAKVADDIMKRYEESNSIFCPILEMYFSIANCDRMFRKSLPQDALRYAERALELAKDNMREYVQSIQNRIDFLRRNTFQFTKPMLTEEDTSTELPY